MIENCVTYYYNGVYDWKKYANEDLEIDLTSFIRDKQNVWFQGKDVAQILGYCDTDKAIKNHRDEKDKKSYPAILAGQVR